MVARLRTVKAMELRRRAGWLAVVGCASLAFAACGGGETGSALPPNPDVVVKAPYGRGLVFDQTAYSAKAGDITIAYVNEDVQAHTMIIEDSTGKKVSAFKRIVLGAHRQTGATVNLAAGAYELVCDIHLPTMVATLTVNP